MNNPPLSKDKQLPNGGGAEVDDPVSTGHCRGVRLLKFPLLPDPRGNLVFAEFPRHLPFQPKRYFITYDVPIHSVRGEHAHKQLEQLIVCLKGALVVTVDDGNVREQYTLDSPDVGLYLPPLIWGIQTGHSPDCLMLVLASEVYDEADYLRNYDAFMACVQARRANPEGFNQ